VQQGRLGGEAWDRIGAFNTYGSKFGSPKLRDLLLWRKKQEFLSAIDAITPSFPKETFG